jgi:hypothetical protein
VAAARRGSADRLLDWLEVPRRHVQPDPDPALQGLVLLDLPDHDSTRLENRLEVDRLVELVDVLVWVLDPQKYADAAVHDRYLAPHAGPRRGAARRPQPGRPARARDGADRHGRPAPAARQRGPVRHPVLPVSARTGDGLPALRRGARPPGGAAPRGQRPADRRRPRRAGGPAGPLRRRRAELAKSSAAPDPGAVGRRRGAGGRERRRAVGPARRHRPHRAGRRCAGPPGCAPDPLGRLHVGNADSRTSLPPASPAQRAAVTTTLRRARDSAGAGLPQAWRDDLRRTVEVSRSGSATASTGPSPAPTSAPTARRCGSGGRRAAVAARPDGARRRAVAARLVGLGYLQLDDVVPLPRVEGIPLPTLLLVGGLLAGCCSRCCAAARRRRRPPPGRRAQRRLDDAVEQVAREEVLVPLERAGEDHDRYCSAVTRAAG